MTAPVECLDEMPHAEFVVWRALDAVRGDEAEARARQQKKGMRQR